MLIKIMDKEQAKIQISALVDKYKELEKSGGLDSTRWFEMSEIPELRIYTDIIPLIAKAVDIISKK